MIIYAICLVVGLVFTLVSVFLGHFFGGGHDSIGTAGHAEAGVGSSGMPGVVYSSAPRCWRHLSRRSAAFGLMFSEIPATQQHLAQRAAGVC